MQFFHFFPLQPEFLGTLRGLELAKSMLQLPSDAAQLDIQIQMVEDRKLFMITRWR